MAREFEHVVGVARLGGVRPERLGQFLFGRKQLAVTMTANHIRALLDDRVPEEQRSCLKGRVSVQFVLLGGSDKLGDLRVRVQPCELVLIVRSGIDYAVMIEAKR